ncbi:MAG: NAD(P)/FAD-dependent oxidoreductase [Clostridiales bacterium]|nr:NAD(P)/FAD-dependent oxidoreductase [Clostridiales bacterium]
MNEIIVIGGGAAGLLAAYGAAKAGARVTLLEKNEKLGKKIYITGKGRCNVTNACEPESFRSHVVKNPRFLFSALNAFAPSDMMALLEQLGCPVKVERGNRVFPESDKASDVTRALEKELRRLGVTIRLNTEIQRIHTAEGRVTGVTVQDGRTLPADAVIVATGGMSYPTTGSTGDGFHWLAAMDHTVFPAMPTLIPLTSDAQWVHALQGLSLRNVRLSLQNGKKKLYTELGEMLFTHFGITGPLVLSASAYMAELPPEEVSLTIDLKPALTPEQLDARILRDVGQAGKKQLGTVLGGLYPARLAETMAQLCALDDTVPACELTREGRAALVERTKALRIPLSGTRPLTEAVVTRGGVSVKEINPATMESKLVSGLYIAGELLDVDALTGGYNLQIAFSTGILAGKSAAEAAGY